MPATPLPPTPRTIPANMHRLPIDRAQKEIEDGIASVTAALADGTAPAPFFRIPGLGRSDVIEEYAESKGLQIWSADFPADDWRHVSSQRVYDLAIQRLEAKGKGILLLHDIQARTVAALPRILRELKARGYRIVHVVPATPERPATPTEPQQWQLNPASEMVATSRWPKIPNFVYATTATLPAPALADLEWHDTAPADRAQRRAWRDAQWSRQVTLVLDRRRCRFRRRTFSSFRNPCASRCCIRRHPRGGWNGRLRPRVTSKRQPSRSRSGPASRAARSAPPRYGSRPRPGTPRTSPRTQASAGKGAAKHAAQAKPAKKNARAVRVAGLKKR